MSTKKLTSHIIKELIDFSLDGKQSFSKLITNGKLTRHERDYGISGIPSIGESDEFIKSSYIPNVIKKIKLACGAIGILYLDISNFYSSIYTHLIPAILLGYNEASKQYKLYEQNHNNCNVTPTYKKYRKFDEMLGSLNAKRTNGLLTGPVMSYIIAETLLARIDKEIENEGITFTRYSDDYEIVIYDKEDIDLVISIITKILEKYNLTLNREKTKYEGFPYYTIHNLEKIYEKYLQQEVRSIELMELFDRFFYLEKDGTKGAIRFLIRSFDERITINDWGLLGSYLINILVNDDRSLIKVCNLLYKSKDNFRLSQKNISTFKNLLNQYIESNKDLEVIWLIFLLKNLGVNNFEKEIVKKIIESKNELAIIIIIYEYWDNLDDGLLDIIRQNAKSWILLYQLYLENIISKDYFKEATGINHNLAFYTKLKRKNFTFYKKI